MPKSFLRFSKASGSTKQKIERIIRQARPAARRQFVTLDTSWNDADHLCVKELASALKVSNNYVYEMRRCGFRMNGVKRQGQTATCEQAVKWIKDNDFRLRDGCGVVKSGNPSV